jgi:hypothetical protein
MMKSSKKITRIRLDALTNDMFFLYGIVSSEPDYKLSLALNKKMGIFLKNRAPLKLHNDTGNELSFSRFSYTNDDDDVIYELISNRSEKQYLLKKLKNIDYIFHVHFHGNDIIGSKVTSLLRDTESVNAVFVIDPNTFSDKNLQHIIH